MLPSFVPAHPDTLEGQMMLPSLVPAHPFILGFGRMCGAGNTFSYFCQHLLGQALPVAITIFANDSGGGGGGGGEDGDDDDGDDDDDDDDPSGGPWRLARGRALPHRAPLRRRHGAWMGLAPGLPVSVLRSPQAGGDWLPGVPGSQGAVLAACDATAGRVACRGGCAGSSPAFR